MKSLRGNPVCDNAHALISAITPRRSRPAQLGTKLKHLVVRQVELVDLTLDRVEPADQLQDLGALLRPMLVGIAKLAQTVSPAVRQAHRSGPRQLLVHPITVRDHDALVAAKNLFARFEALARQLVPRMVTRAQHPQRLALGALPLGQQKAGLIGVQEVRFEDALLERLPGRLQHVGQSTLLIPQRLLGHHQAVPRQLVDLAMQRQVINDLRGRHRHREIQRVATTRNQAWPPQRRRHHCGVAAAAVLLATVDHLDHALELDRDLFAVFRLIAHRHQSAVAKQARTLILGQRMAHRHHGQVLLRCRAVAPLLRPLERRLQLRQLLDLLLDLEPLQAHQEVELGLVSVLATQLSDLPLLLTHQVEKLAHLAVEQDVLDQQLVDRVLALGDLHEVPPGFLTTRTRSQALSWSTASAQVAFCQPLGCLRETDPARPSTDAARHPVDLATDRRSDPSPDASPAGTGRPVEHQHLGAHAVARDEEKQIS